MIRLIEVAANTGATAGSVGLIISQIPAIPLPDGFQDWPAQAIMGFVTVASLAVMCFVFKAHLKNASEAAKSVSESAVALNRVATAQQESCVMQETTNKLLTETVTKLDMRPCMAKDLVELMDQINKAKDRK